MTLNLTLVAIQSIVPPTAMNSTYGAHWRCCDTNKSALFTSRMNTDKVDGISNRTINYDTKTSTIYVFSFAHAVFMCLLIRGPKMEKIAAKRRKISVQKGFATDRSLFRIPFFFVRPTYAAIGFYVSVCQKLTTYTHGNVRTFPPLLHVLVSHGINHLSDGARACAPANAHKYGKKKTENGNWTTIKLKS